MANPGVIAAIANRLKAASKVTGLLGADSTSIVAAGRLSQTSPSRPAIVVQDGGEIGSARSRPWIEQLVNIRVYGSAESPNTADYFSLRNILQECINSLDRAPLSTQESYTHLFEVLYDNYMSPDLWDQQLEMPYKQARFCAKGVRPRYDPQSA